MKINSRMHGGIDYGVVLFLLFAPSVFLLPPVTALVTYALAAIHFVLTICTDFESGLFRIIPFKVHGWIELAVSFALVGVGLYLGSLEGNLAKFFYFSFAIAVFAVWALTDYSGNVRGRRFNP